MNLISRNKATVVFVSLAKCCIPRHVHYKETRQRLPSPKASSGKSLIFRDCKIFAAIELGGPRT